MIQFKINLEINILLTKFRNSCPTLISFLSLLNFLLLCILYIRIKKCWTTFRTVEVEQWAIDPKILSETFANEFSFIYFTDYYKFSIYITLIFLIHSVTINEKVSNYFQLCIYRKNKYLISQE